MLRVLNRELGADFAVDRFAHVAGYDRTQEWIEMRLRSLVDQAVHIPGVGLTVSFTAG